MSGLHEHNVGQSFFLPCYRRVVIYLLLLAYVAAITAVIIFLGRNITGPDAISTLLRSAYGERPFLILLYRCTTNLASCVCMTRQCGHVCGAERGGGLAARGAGPAGVGPAAAAVTAPGHPGP